MHLSALNGSQKPRQQQEGKSEQREQQHFTVNHWQGVIFQLSWISLESLQRGLLQMWRPRGQLFQPGASHMWRTNWGGPLLSAGADIRNLEQSLVKFQNKGPPHRTNLIYLCQDFFICYFVKLYNSTHYSYTVFYSEFEKLTLSYNIIFHGCQVILLLNPTFPHLNPSVHVYKKRNCDKFLLIVSP